MFGIAGESEHRRALDPEVLYSTVCEGDCRFMDEWVSEEENASEKRWRKMKKVEEAG